MKGDHIYYRDGYKYVLSETYIVLTPITRYDVRSQFILLTPDGTLTIIKGYAWDGASGPTIDTKSSMRGSLVHDAFYQLERENLISPAERDNIDRLLETICVEDGMLPLRAAFWRLAVQLFGGPCADPNRDHPPLIAP